MRIGIVGAGNHGRVIKDIISYSSDLELVGFFDDNEDLINSNVEGIPVLGKLSLENKNKFSVEAVVLGIGDNSIRESFYKKVKELNLYLPNVIHPSSVISESVKFGEGVVIMPGVIINTGSFIGNNVCINTGAQLDHDNYIGNHVHINPGVILGGCVKIGEYSCIGMGALLRDHINIGSNSLVGMGAVVTKDVPDNVTTYGNPAKIIKKE